MQGSPKDPENFPFVVLGNKLDKASERKVNNLKFMKKTKFLVFSKIFENFDFFLKFLKNFGFIEKINRSAISKPSNGAKATETSFISRPVQRMPPMWNRLFKLSAKQQPVKIKMKNCS